MVTDAQVQLSTLSRTQDRRKSHVWMHLLMLSSFATTADRLVLCMHLVSRLDHVKMDVLFRHVLGTAHQ